MIHLSIEGKAYRFNPEKPDFQGNEGRLYRLPGQPGKLVKIFKNESEFQGSDPGSRRLREMARKRGELVYKKLVASGSFPKGVVAPEGLILNGEGSAAALLLPEVVDAHSIDNLKSEDWKKDHGYSVHDVATIFLELHSVVTSLHKSGMVIGDFKPANILFRKGAVFILDCESFKMGNHPATGFDEEYADPRWIGKAAEIEEREIPQPTEKNDWFSFSMMYFESLTGIGPYAGVYFPKIKGATIPPEDRAWKGVTVFDPQVKLPKHAAGLSILTSSEVTYFRRRFEHKHSATFNRKLIELRTVRSA